MTWGINPFSSYNYAELPRTKVDAEAKGWVNMAPGTACGGNFSGGVSRCNIIEKLSISTRIDE